jgi:hypothetical protein
MLNFLFRFIHLLAVSFYDCWKMTKSELVYWYEGKNYIASASEAASVSQFAFWYFYVFVTAFILFDPLTALLNIVCVVFLHWCGVEDLLYYFWMRWFPPPAKYYEYHPMIKILGFEIPKSLYWLSRPRIVAGITIPSIIGFVCGKEVEAKRFVVFTTSMMVLVAVLSFIV